MIQQVATPNAKGVPGEFSAVPGQVAAALQCYGKLQRLECSDHARSDVVVGFGDGAEVWGAVEREEEGVHEAAWAGDNRKATAAAPQDGNPIGIHRFLLYLQIQAG